MKIRLLMSIAGMDFSWAPGEVVDLPEATARAFADGVRAELVEPAADQKPAGDDEKQETKTPAKPKRTRKPAETADSGPDETRG